MTIQATQGQILVDVLTELQALHDDLVSTRRSPSPPFDDDSYCPLAIRHKKGE